MKHPINQHVKQFLSVLLCICMSIPSLFWGSSMQVASAAETIMPFTPTQDAFVSNFNGQGSSLGTSLSATKLIYGKMRHTYFKFDLSSIDTERYDVGEMNMMLSFRKSHSPNELVFTESESTLRDTSTDWTVTNVTYNNRPYDIVGSPVVTQEVTSNGEENLTVDLSTIFQHALSQGRKVVSIHLTTTKVNDSTVGASELYSSRNTTYPGPSLNVTLGNPIVNDGVDRTALSALISQADQFDETAYTTESWAIYSTALTTAKDLLVNNTTQSEVNQAILTLQSAMNNLVDAELPSKLTGPDMGNYFNNSKTAAMILTMKNGEGQYVKVDPVTEKLSLTSNAAEASPFALYVLDYFATVDHVEPEVGATRTAYSIKSLVNNKYLTIQNYFSAEEFLSNTHQYFHIVSGAPSGSSTDRTFEIKASASTPGWNERFYVDQYANSGYYRIWSHLSTMRDDTNFNRFNVKMTDNAMLSSGTASEDTEYRFYFEKVTGKDQLEVSQEVSGDDAALFWKPVNGDTNPANYSVNGTVSGAVYTEGLMHLTISGLNVGVHPYAVAYNGSGYQTEADVKVRIFSHPGILLTMEDLEKMKAHIQAKEEPWYSDYQRMVNGVSYDVASYEYQTMVFSNVGRGGAPSDSGNIGYFEKGGNAAYFNALQWVITGDNLYAAKAADLLMQWANTLKVIDGRDRILGAGINAYKYASAAEIIKHYHGGYSGYSDTDFKALKDMMINVVYPVIQDAGVPMLANGNWDVAALVSMMAIGVLCDNSEIFDRAMTFYQDIHTNGSIFAYVNDSGQTMETGRDQAHAMLALGYMSELCMIAKNQNVDLYSLYTNRLAKAFEYVAKYNLYAKELYGEDLPFVAMPNVFGDTSRGYYGAGFNSDSNGLNRGEFRPIFEQGLALYSKVDGVDLTWTARAAAAMRPQGMVHFDNLNFGTMTYYNGEPDREVRGPYFQMRTRWEPLYQRNWSTVDGQKVAETLNSYYDVNENGELTTSVMKNTAPFYQMVANDDGSYSILLLKTNTFLSVKDEQVGDYNVIKADATEIGDHEKFILRASGVGPFFLVSPMYENRIVYQDAAGSGSSSMLTLRLGTKTLSQIKDTPDITTNERLIFMYNTQDIALFGSAAPSITSAASTVVSSYGGTFQVTATGTAPISYTLEGEPDGVTMNSSTGLITVADTTGVGTYMFTVRASNGISPDTKMPFTLTVVEAPTVPGAPQNFTAMRGNRQVTLSWDAPSSNGGAVITKYEVSKDNGQTWLEADSFTGHIFTGLANGTTYTFSVRAVNSAGSGPETEAQAAPKASSSSSSGSSSITAGPVQDEETHSISLNGNSGALTLNEDGSYSLASTGEQIKQALGDSNELVIHAKDVSNLSVGLPVSAMGTASLTVTSDIGSVTVPNATLQNMAKKYGDSLVLRIRKGSYMVELLDNGKPAEYDDPGYPLTITLPVKVTEGREASNYVVIKKENGRNVILPLAVGDGERVTFDVTATGTYDVVDNSLAFQDVISSDWAAKDIGFVTARRLFEGTGDKQFNPEASMTRAMFTQVLANLEGIDRSESRTPEFSDVPDGQWYTGAVDWASKKGIINGTRTNTFSPEDSVTREQMAIMLYNYASSKGYKLSIISGTEFADKDSVSPWAREAVHAIAAAGILTGKPGGYFDPQTNATRAEVAAVFARFIRALSSN
ncbi:S-layer homology domain-containing protein [Paenibacillus hexagrammi]|uniref:S-layer homology domain-containing protein n=1 Tax=Paenibacillus hexagrammi TaxID=2908839 RepID=A0ABY3SMA1_9BACL|nr:S-layer homology domain-containing protein [Paenibacillus sp. YPD9-1]UJF34849.1 S-layer homology domain-containing protein [Paenibacillus sp. YPD9-1]